LYLGVKGDRRTHDRVNKVPGKKKEQQICVRKKELNNTTRRRRRDITLGGKSRKETETKRWSGGERAPTKINEFVKASTPLGKKGNGRGVSKKTTDNEESASKKGGATAEPHDDSEDQRRVRGENT